MASVERESITAVWGRAPSGVQCTALGQGQETNPLKLKAFCLSEIQMRHRFVNFFQSCKLLKYTFQKNIVACISV